MSSVGRLPAVFAVGVVLLAGADAFMTTTG